MCDALLASEHLRPHKSDFWLAAFRLVRKIIGGVDYKGVREIMKHSIEKVTAMAAPDPALEPQVQVVRELLNYIFDRNAALLPGSFPDFLLRKIFSFGLYVYVINLVDMRESNP